MSTIQAAVGQNFLSKADRLFTNMLSDVFIELLQNARRAGASDVEVTLKRHSHGTNIVFADNGEGVVDFGVLLHLGNSDWDSAIADKEDPAGMGFFSLVHSGVTVRSRGQKAVIPKAGFLGSQLVDVVASDGPEQGTELVFDRPEVPSVVGQMLASAARFGPLKVTINGTRLLQEDFLNEALLVKQVDGARLGVHTSYSEVAGNFYGRLLKGDQHLPYLSRAILDRDGRRRDLYVRVDVLDARRFPLKLPDRTDIIQDEHHAVLSREAKIAMYEYLASRREHCASFSAYSEAHMLGIPLKEAAPRFRTFFEYAAHAALDVDLFPAQCSVSADARSHAIVERDEDSVGMLAFSFLVGLRHFFALPLQPIEDAPEYEGYSWYGSIPRLRNFRLVVDGTEVGSGSDFASMVTLADSIQLSVTLDRSGTEEEQRWDLPFAAFADSSRSDGLDSAVLVITRTSPWAVPELAPAPFDLVEAAVYLCFSPNYDRDEDSAETQMERFRKHVQMEITRTLGGALAQARQVLEEALNGRRLFAVLEEAGISEIRLRRRETGEWDSDLVTVRAA